MSWIGGKKALRHEIIARFPSGYERYIEVFGGAGWVFFAKQPERFEVFNDFNGLLVNLYRCVRERPEALIEELRYTLNARADFEAVRAALAQGAVLSDERRAAHYYKLIRFSYASGLASFGAQPHDMWSDFPLIRDAHRRIGGAVIENKDFGKLIGQYDRPGSLFYCDPPYFGTEAYYQNIGKQGFTLEDHIRLRDILLHMQGRFLLSYNDCAFVRELYSSPNIYLEAITRLDNIKQRYQNGAEYAELLIANYDMNAQRCLSPTQLTLFGGVES